MNDLGPPPFVEPANANRNLARGAWLFGIASLIIPINTAVFLGSDSFHFKYEDVEPFLILLALAQLGLGLAAVVFGIKHAATRGVRYRGVAVLLAIASAVVGLGGIVGALLAWVLPGLGAIGGAWGRPLRLRGRLLHPELKHGSDWAHGDRPDPRGLSEPTRRALEALWLHDAQKEHASVPAFTRVGWLLAAVGAPAELLAGSQRAALEEVDHAQRCFALAAGYGGRAHTVEPMPELLVGGLDLRGDARVQLAIDSLKDGCLLEDFNADVAGACVPACTEPAVRGVLERIAREERSHADFSWALLAWLAAHGGPKVRPAIARSIDELGAVARPTAVSAKLQPLVAQADAEVLRAHGRIPDAEWAALWIARLDATTARARSLLAGDALTRAA